MRALVQYALEDGAVELREVDVPRVGDHEALLRIEAVGVCGSDVHQFHNTQSWAVRVPVILGHEFSGRVAKVGEGVDGFVPGDLVVGETAAQINPDSPMTRAGLYNLDPQRSGFGYGINGAMAEYMVVPTRLLHHVPKGVAPEIAAMTEPCCVAYQATVVNSRISPGDLVVVMGPGPVGLLCAALAKSCGAGTVVVAGTARDATRLRLATTVGATHAVDVQGADLVASIRQLGDGYGADIVIDAAGVSESLESALEVVRPGGHITKVGWGPKPLGFSIDALVQKAVTLQGSFSHTWAVWERVLRLLETRQLDPRPLLSRVSGLDDWKTSFDGMHAGDFVKPVLRP